MRNSIIGLCLALMAGLVLTISPIGRTQARAAMLVSGQNASLCMDATSGNVILANCTASAGQDFFNSGGYGQQKYGPTKCLQGSGAQLYLAACNAASNDQQWLIDAAGAYRNRGGWCANVSGGRAAAGTPVIAFKCDGSPNEVWARGTKTTGTTGQQVATLRTAAVGSIVDTAGHSISKLIGEDGASIVSHDGGTIISHDAGSLIALGNGAAIRPDGGAGH